MAEDDGSASDAGYQFADDNERRSSFPTINRKQKTPAKVRNEDDDDEEADGEKDSKKRKAGRPRKASTATQNKSSAKSAGGKGGAKRGGKSTRGGRGGKTSAADKQAEDTRDFMAFFNKASQATVKSSNSLAPPNATRVSSLKPPAPPM